MIRGRARRPDDWPSSHVRARADLSDRLDDALDPVEAGWLDAHLEACPDCRSIAAAYATQRLELRAMRDRSPQPPRDLWARTAAAIESESRFRDRDGNRARTDVWRRRGLAAPSAFIATALVVAVAAGLLTSSWRFGGGGTTGSSANAALASQTASAAPGSTTAGPTPIAVAKRVEYLVQDADGGYSFRIQNVDAVCPPSTASPCDTTAPQVGRSVALDQSASSVFGSPNGDRLIVVNGPTTASTGNITVVTLPSQVPDPTPIPTTTPIATATALPSPSLVATSAAPAGPSPTPVPTAASPSAPPPTPSTTPVISASPNPTPSASVAVTPLPSGTVEIAHDVALVGQSAAYSKSGGWFAFTARPVDGSAGPDIYLWKVGNPEASRVTTDHRSVFGSWSGDQIVGSTVVERTGAGNGSTSELNPSSFFLDPSNLGMVDLPQAGSAWRPAVDPTGPRAVYWTGSVRATAEPGFAPDAGRLVLGDWDVPTPQGSGAPPATPVPTPLPGDQSHARHETTLAAGRILDWDARWDASGTHLAVWIADEKLPDVGRLSLYSVDPFDGKIDLKTPLLDGQPANAGFSISDGQLVWAEPATAGTVGSGSEARMKLLAWTDTGVGTVETESGPVIVIR